MRIKCMPSKINPNAAIPRLETRATFNHGKMVPFYAKANVITKELRIVLKRCDEHPKFSSKIMCKNSVSSLGLSKHNRLIKHKCVLCCGLTGDTTPHRDSNKPKSRKAMTVKPVKKPLSFSKTKMGRAIRFYKKKLFSQHKKIENCFSKSANQRNYGIPCDNECVSADNILIHKTGSRTFLPVKENFDSFIHSYAKPPLDNSVENITHAKQALFVSANVAEECVTDQLPNYIKKIKPPSQICRNCGKDFDIVSFIKENQESSKDPRQPFFMKTFLDPIKFATVPVCPTTTKRSTIFYHCIVCPMMYLQQNNLQNHMKVHAEKISISLICEYCFQVFISNSNVRRHIKAVHSQHANVIFSTQKEIGTNEETFDSNFNSYDSSQSHGFSKFVVRVPDTMKSIQTIEWNGMGEHWKSFFITDRSNTYPVNEHDYSLPLACYLNGQAFDLERHLVGLFKIRSKTVCDPSFQINDEYLNCSLNGSPSYLYYDYISPILARDLNPVEIIVQCSPSTETCVSSSPAFGLKIPEQTESVKSVYFIQDNGFKQRSTILDPKGFEREIDKMKSMNTKIPDHDNLASQGKVYSLKEINEVIRNHERILYSSQNSLNNASCVKNGSTQDSSNIVKSPFKSILIAPQILKDEGMTNMRHEISTSFFNESCKQFQESKEAKTTESNYCISLSPDIVMNVSQVSHELPGDYFTQQLVQDTNMPKPETSTCAENSNSFIKQCPGSPTTCSDIPVRMFSGIETDNEMVRIVDSVLLRHLLTQRYAFTQHLTNNKVIKLKVDQNLKENSEIFSCINTKTSQIKELVSKEENSSISSNGNKNVSNQKSSVEIITIKGKNANLKHSSQKTYENSELCRQLLNFDQYKPGNFADLKQLSQNVLPLNSIGNKNAEKSSSNNNEAQCLLQKRSQKGKAGIPIEIMTSGDAFKLQLEKEKPINLRQDSKSNYENIFTKERKVFGNDKQELGDREVRIPHSIELKVILKEHVKNIASSRIQIVPTLEDLETTHSENREANSIIRLNLVQDSKGDNKSQSNGNHITLENRSILSTQLTSIPVVTLKKLNLSENVNYSKIPKNEILPKGRLVKVFNSNLPNVTLSNTRFDVVGSKLSLPNRNTENSLNTKNNLQTFLKTLSRKGKASNSPNANHSNVSFVKVLSKTSLSSGLNPNTPNLTHSKVPCDQVPQIPKEGDVNSSANNNNLQSFLKTLSQKTEANNSQKTNHSITVLNKVPLKQNFLKMSNPNTKSNWCDTQLQNGHKCSECGMMFSKSNLSRSREHFSAGKKLHRCLQCNYALKTESQSHNRRKIVQKRRTVLRYQPYPQIASDPGFRCIEHPKTFSNKASLDTHYVYPSQVQWTCGVCSISFKDQNGLKIHNRRAHQFQCEKCGQACTDYSRLKIHLKMWHQKRINHWYPCKYCGKMFANFQDLKLHWKCHRVSREKHCCSICEQKFVSRFHLRKHILSDHPQRRPKKLCTSVIPVSTPFSQESESKFETCSSTNKRKSNHELLYKTRNLSCQGDGLSNDRLGLITSPVSFCDVIFREPLNDAKFMSSNQTSSKIIPIKSTESCEPEPFKLEQLNEDYDSLTFFKNRNYALNPVKLELSAESSKVLRNRVSMLSTSGMKKESSLQSETPLSFIKVKQVTRPCSIKLENSKKLKEVMQKAVKQMTHKSHDLKKHSKNHFLSEVPVSLITVGKVTRPCSIKLENRKNFNEVMEKAVQQMTHKSHDLLKPRQNHFLSVKLKKSQNTSEQKRQSFVPYNMSTSTETKLSASSLELENDHGYTKAVRQMTHKSHNFQTPGQNIFQSVILKRSQNTSEQKSQKFVPYNMSASPKSKLVTSSCSLEKDHGYTKNVTLDRLGGQYKCSQCDAYFDKTLELWKHQSTVHKILGTLKCTSCSAVFKGRNDLRKHMQNHADQNLITCTKCSKTFTETRSLKFHFQTEHLRRGKPMHEHTCIYHAHLKSEKNWSVTLYKCKHCELSFTTERRTVTSMKPTTKK